MERETVTRDDIRALQQEAAQAGDKEMVKMCERALIGWINAREKCSKIIRAARATTDAEVA